MKQSKLLVALLALMLVFALAIPTLAATPVLVVTGNGIVNGATATDLSANITNEKAYTLEELKALGAETVIYSALNSKGTPSVFKAEGVPIVKLLTASGLTAKTSIKLIAADGYESVLDLAIARYYFPAFAQGSAEGKIEVPALLAWAEGGKKGETVIPAEVTAISSLKSYVGMDTVSGFNNNLFVTGVCTMQIGDALPAVLTVNGKEYTRAEILKQERTTKTYTYTNSKGEAKDEVRGVLLADLLGKLADDAIISFTAADGYDISAMSLTYADAKAKNYMLAYEQNTNGTWTAIYEKGKKSGVGYFTLYGENLKPAKMINSISVKLTEKPAPEIGKTIVLTLNKTAATIDGKEVLMDVAPEVVMVNGGGVTFVPIRFVTENLGLSNNWDAKAPADVKLAGTAFTGTIVIGSVKATINGTEKTLLAAPYVSNNRTMVPLRFLSENLGHSVTYDAAAQTITIK